MQTVPVYLIQICVQVCIYVCVSIFVCLFIYVCACLATSQLDTNSHTSVLTFPENAMSSSQNRYIKGCKHILVAVMFSGIRTILIQKKGKTGSLLLTRVIYFKKHNNKSLSSTRQHRY